MDVRPLPELHAMIQSSGSTSLVRKYLNSDIVTKYAGMKTNMGGTLAQCVNTNAYNPNALLCRAADMECYEKFRDFFEPLIKDYHKVSTPTIVHPRSDFGDEKRLPAGNIDPTGKYVVSTRVRVGRTVRGFAFAPVISKADRISLEQKIAGALRQLTGEWTGDYYSLSNMPETTRQDLVARHFLFRDDDSVLRDAGGYRDWPTGRGIFINKNMTFLVWINEEDHMRIISMEKGGDLVKVYMRLINGIKQLEKMLDFVRSDRFGYVTFCPSNLGTTMRASVHVRIPRVSQLPNFKAICEQYNMQARGTDGEHTAVVGGVYDLSNKRRLGITELQAAKEMAEGVAAIIAMERSMDDMQMASSVPPVEPLTVLAPMLWNDPSCNSMVKRYLSQNRVMKYQNMRTRNCVTLAHCLRHCAYHRQENCPVLGDVESLVMFSEFMDDIIQEYHRLPTIKHVATNFGNLNNLPFRNMDASGRYILNTRIRVDRSVESFCLSLAITKDQRLQLEKTIANALMSLQGELHGNYYPLQSMDQKIKNQLMDCHLLFTNDDEIVKDSGGYRDWPTGRGVFTNANRTFLAWVQNLDHLRLISTEAGGNLNNIYKRLVQGIQTLGNQLKFARNDRYGFLTSSPANLGTSLRITVQIRLPKLMSNTRKLEEVCSRTNLIFRKSKSVFTDGVLDVSNRQMIGLNEIDLVSNTVKGIEELIRQEMAL